MVNIYTSQQSINVEEKDWLVVDRQLGRYKAALRLELMVEKVMHLVYKLNCNCICPSDCALPFISSNPVFMVLTLRKIVLDQRVENERLLDIL